MKKMFKTTVAVSLLAVLAACGSTPKEELTAKNSGFLSNYANLQEVDTDESHILLRWKSDEMVARGYTHILIDEVTFYPAPSANKDVPRENLTAITEYVNSTIMGTAEKSGKLTTKSGPKTLRMRLAITGASIDDQGLSAVQYLPIAFVASAASGNLDNLAAKLVIEGEVTDSQTGEHLASIVRTGIGAEVEEENAKLTLKMVKPVIDGWAKMFEKSLEADLK